MRIAWVGWIDPSATPFGEVLDAADSRAVLERFLPGIGENPMIEMARVIPVETVLEMAGGALDEDASRALRSELAAL